MKAAKLTAGEGVEGDQRDGEGAEPAEGEILVRVEASSINGFDLSVAKGVLKGMMEHRFPVVLGKDFAGTVERSAPASATSTSVTAVSAS